MYNLFNCYNNVIPSGLMRIGLIQIIEGRTQPRRGEIFIANSQDNKPQPRRGGIIIKP